MATNKTTPTPAVDTDPGREERSPWPDSEADVSAWTDKYFKRTQAIVEKFGDASVTYALFMRRPVVSAPKLAIDWLEAMARRRGTSFEIDLRYREGKWVGAGEPIFYITGAFR
ncbi:MAG: hypothetical protein V3R85_01640, partial [Alphaproteobacteria bacterium]